MKLALVLALLAAGPYGDQVMEVIRERKQALGRCYERDPDAGFPSGGYSLRFTIGSDGKVKKVTTGWKGALDACLREQIGRWVFPKPPGGGEVEIAWPINVDAR